MGNAFEVLYLRCLKQAIHPNRERPGQPLQQRNGWVEASFHISLKVLLVIAKKLIPSGML